MSLFIQNNSGPIYTDCTITIHNGQTTVETPEKTQQPETKGHKVQDVDFEEVHNHFRYITQVCRKANMLEHVENHLRTACSGSAEALWKCIHDYEMMDYLSTQVIDASTLYDEICAYFGALPYDKRNFRKYR